MVARGGGAAVERPVARETEQPQAWGSRQGERGLCAGKGVGGSRERGDQGGKG